MNEKSVNDEKKLLLKEQIKALNSGDRDRVLLTLRTIRDSGTTYILPEIFKLMSKTVDEEIVKTCRRLLNDLKSNDVKPYVIAAINDPDLKGIQSQIVASCWESGLDYHDHTDLFVELVITGPYEVAIEAFTLIENSIGSLDDKKLISIISKLNKALPSADNTKTRLIEALISIIKEF